MVRKDAWNVSVFLNLLRLDLWPRMWSILVNVLCALEKKVKFIVLGEMSYRYQLGLTGLFYHLSLCFLVNFLFS